MTNKNQVQCSKTEENNCYECNNFTFRTDGMDRGSIWYSQYCKANPKSPEEKTQENKREHEHFEKWCKSTNNGAACKVLFAPGSGDYQERSEVEKNYHLCNESRESSKSCSNYSEIDQMKWMDKFLILPRKVEGKLSFLETVSVRKRRTIKRKPYQYMRFKSSFEFKRK